MDRYQNRREAGKILASKLMQFKNKPNTMILALPRGGVPVAYEVASALNLPFDVFIVRKLGLPTYKELAMGAIAEGDIIVFNDEVINDSSVTQQALNAVIDEEKAELLRRQKKYRGHIHHLALKNKHIILVDDGIATGATMRAAVSALRQLQVASVTIAVPVAQKDFARDIKQVDQFVCPLLPDQLNAVGAWYHDFSETVDEEVIALLKNKTI